MIVTITPDPSFPLGGYAIATFKGAQPPERQVNLKISRLEDGYYLGESNWSSNQSELGPFEVVAQDGGVALRLGPEVVNLVEPFQRIRIEAPALGASSELPWPETIRKSAAGSRRGSIHRRREGSVQSPGTENKKKYQPETDNRERQLPGIDNKEEQPPGTDNKESQSRGYFRWVAALLVLLVATAGVGAWFYAKDKVSPPFVTENGNTTQSAPVLEASCSPEGIGQSEAAQLYERAQACGRRDIGVKEQMISRAALQAHGPALLQQAKWFDPAFAGEDSPYETRNAVSATRLYKKALDAGEERARPLLNAVCAKLQTSDDPVVQVTAKNNCD